MSTVDYKMRTLWDKTMPMLNNVIAAVRALQIAITQLQDGETGTGGEFDLSSLYKEFDTVADMLADETPDLLFAYTKNWSVTDGEKARWMRTADDLSALVNSTSVLESTGVAGTYFVKISP